MVGSFSYATVSAQLNGLPLRTPTHERNGIKAVRQHDQGDRAKYIGVNRVVKGRGLESVCVLLQPHKNPHQGERGTQAAGEHKRGHRLRPRSEGRHQGESHGDDSRSELSTKGNESRRPIIRSHDDPFLDFRRYILYTLTPPQGTARDFHKNHSDAPRQRQLFQPSHAAKFPYSNSVVSQAIFRGQHPT